MDKCNIFEQKCMLHNSIANMYCTCCSQFICSYCPDPHSSTGKILLAHQIASITEALTIQKQSATLLQIKSQLNTMFYNSIQATTKCFNQMLNHSFQSSCETGINMLSNLPAQAKADLEKLTNRSKNTATQTEDKNVEMIRLLIKKEIQFTQFVRNIFGNLEENCLLAHNRKQYNISHQSVFNNSAYHCKLTQIKKSINHSNDAIIEKNKIAPTIVPANNLYSTIYKTLFDNQILIEDNLQVDKEINSKIKSAIELHSQPNCIYEVDQKAIGNLFRYQMYMVNEYHCAVFNYTYMLQMNKWIGKTCKYRLLLRASTDGYTAKAFHARCDSKSPTLTIIKNNYEKVIGGYTPIAWTSSNAYYSDSTMQSFVFSMATNKKYGLKGNERAICGWTPSCALFGDWDGQIKSHYIAIRDNCNVPNSCEGNSKCPTYDEETYANFVGRNDGSYLYSVVDYEVFEVLFD